jgi:hypothetical protein
LRFEGENHKRKETRRLEAIGLLSQNLQPFVAIANSAYARMPIIRSSNRFGALRLEQAQHGGCADNNFRV